MKPGHFLDQQLLDAIQWNEPEPDILACRYPMLDTEIQTGAKLTVRESEMAIFVDQGRVADVFAPGTYTLNSASLPLLSALRHWPLGFESPFKSDLYFFSAHLEINQKWGGSMPVPANDENIGDTRLRSYGIYSYRLADPRAFFTQVSSIRESYSAYELDDRLRNIVVARMTDAVAAAGLSHLDFIANHEAFSDKVIEQVKPAFAALGLELTQFTLQNISLANDLQSSGERDSAGPDAPAAQAVSKALRSSAASANGLDPSNDTKSSIDCSCCGASMRPDIGSLKCDYCHNVVLREPSGDGVSASVATGSLACPACAVSLMQATIGGASLLYCTRCDGMLVAMQQFETLIAASRALPGAPIPAQPANPVDLQQRIACPQCRRSMEAHFYSGPGNVVIDTCGLCSVNWLDHGQLARIAHAPVSDFAAESNAIAAGPSYFDAPPHSTACNSNA